MRKRKKQDPVSSTLKEQEAEIERREKALADKATAFKAEQEELRKFKRSVVMENIDSFVFTKAELDSFVSALDGFAQKTDLVTALIHAATSKGDVINMQEFQTKLVRLGFG